MTAYDAERGFTLGGGNVNQGSPAKEEGRLLNRSPDTKKNNLIVDS